MRRFDSDPRLHHLLNNLQRLEEFDEVLPVLPLGGGDPSEWKLNVLGTRGPLWPYGPLLLMHIPFRVPASGIVLNPRLDIAAQALEIDDPHLMWIDENWTRRSLW
jgi:hypothetical protein